MQSVGIKYDNHEQHLGPSNYITVASGDFDNLDTFLQDLEEDLTHIERIE